MILIHVDNIDSIFRAGLKMANRLGEGIGFSGLQGRGRARRASLVLDKAWRRPSVLYRVKAALPASHIPPLAFPRGVCAHQLPPAALSVVVQSSSVNSESKAEPSRAAGDPRTCTSCPSLRRRARGRRTRSCGGGRIRTRRPWCACSAAAAGRARSAGRRRGRTRCGGPSVRRIRTRWCAHLDGRQGRWGW